MEIEDILNFAADLKFIDEDKKMMADVMNLRKYERVLTVYRSRMRPGYVAKAVNVILKKYNKLYKAKIKCEDDELYRDTIEKMIEHIEKNFNDTIMSKITNKILEDYKMNIIQSGRYGF